MNALAENQTQIKLTSEQDQEEAKRATLGALGHAALGGCLTLGIVGAKSKGWDEVSILYGGLAAGEYIRAAGSVLSHRDRTNVAQVWALRDAGITPVEHVSPEQQVNLINLADSLVTPERFAPPSK